MPPSEIEAAPQESLAERVQRRLAVPVLLAALASVPALFLALWGGPTVALAGEILNWTSATVLWVEWLLLIALAENRMEWLKQHKWTLTVALLTVPAAIFSLGPAQLLRLVYLFGTLRILQVKRIFTAGLTIGRRIEPQGWIRALLISVLCLIAAIFVGAMLVDPAGETETWAAAEYVAAHVGLGAVLVVGAAAAATGVVYWYSRRRGDVEDRDVGNNS